MSKDKKKNKIKISSIILYSICGLLFLVAAYGIAIKISNNSLYLFGVRSDAVLSDSMSYKNEDPEVQEFLEGHDNQLQVGDLVYSEKVTDNSELDVYDIVIFIHQDTGKQTIHRIVDIVSGEKYLDHQPRYVIRADTANHESIDGIYSRQEILAKYKSKIPFLGNIVKFFNSIFGTILIVGLIIILLTYDFLASNYVNDKKKTIEETKRIEKTEVEQKDKNES